MRWAQFIVFSSLMLALTPPALAHYVDGNQLRDWIEANNRAASGVARGSDYQDSSHLIGYIEGAYDALEHKTDLYACNTRVGRQLVAVVSAHILNHPESWWKSGSVLVQDAILEACRVNHPSD